MDIKKEVEVSFYMWDSSTKYSDEWATCIVTHGGIFIKEKSVDEETTTEATIASITL
jgi:hypothetical protein